MEFRKAKESDMNNIMEIIKQAQDYFKAQEIDQWQNNYPNIETIQKDIKDGYGYVLLKDYQIVGTVALSFDGEITYQNIYNGAWKCDRDYAVIHRIAVNDKHKGLGLASIIIQQIEKICQKQKINSIRIDTHKENISMQQLIKKNGFEYCGIIYLADKSERLAFEKLL